MKTITNSNTYNYILSYYEKDLNRNLKLVSIFNFLQDVAAIHAESIGIGESFVFSNNLAWFVLKYRFELYENINDIMSLDIKTESRGLSRLFAHRDFHFYNNDKLFARATSQWALVDLTSKKIIKPQDVLHLQNFEKRENDLNFDKIPTLPEITYKKTFQIRFDDIDINKHVNNANYLSWALESLNFDFRNKYIPKIVDIYFKKEYNHEGKIISESFFDEANLTTIHSIKDEATLEELCVLKIEWSNFI